MVEPFITVFIPNRAVLEVIISFLIKRYFFLSKYFMFDNSVIDILTQWNQFI